MAAAIDQTTDPTKSPGLNWLTLSPTALTRPTISWPGTNGYCVQPHSLRAEWMSEWQIPQYRMSMTTSSGRGSRRSKLNGSSAPVGNQWRIRWFSSC